MKKKNLRRFVALLAAAVILTGCSPKPATSNPSDSGTTPPADTSTPADSEKKVYDITLYTSRNQPNPDSEVMKKINEKLGHNLNVISVTDDEYSSKLNLYFSSGDLPDIFTSHSDAKMMKSACATITPEEFETYMPLTYAAAEKQLPILGLTLDKMYDRYRDEEGNLKGLYIGQVGQSVPYGIRIRQDLVDSLNGGKMPETLDDWDAFLAKYKEAFPDKYPISARKDAQFQHFYMIFSAFGTSYHRYCLQDDDTILLGQMMPEYRDALLYLKDWYDKGYINPEFVTMDDATFDNEWKKGNLLYYQYSGLASFTEPPFAEGSMEAILQKNVPEAKLSWCPFPTYKDYNGGKPSVTAGSGMSTECTNFGVHLEKDPDKLHAAMGVMDMLTSDEEIWLLRRFGIEGETYDMIDGVPTYKEAYNQTDAQVQAGINWLYQGQMGVNYDLEMKYAPKHYADNVKTMYEDPDGIYGANRNEIERGYWVGDLLNENGENYESLGSDYENQCSALAVQIIMGQKPIEEYDKLLAEWKANIGDEWMAAATEKYHSQK